MLSRVANHIYWLGRYLERAENYARFIDVNFNLMQDLPVDLKEQWQPLVAATGDLDLYLKKYESYERHQVMFFLTFDLDNPNCMLSAVNRARENARIIRENLSKETWEKANELYYMLQTGLEKKVWKKEDWDQLSKIIENTDIIIISDEVYDLLTYDDYEFRSAFHHPLHLPGRADRAAV